MGNKRVLGCDQSECGTPTKLKSYNIWGGEGDDDEHSKGQTYSYTDDSNLCKAAYHAFGKNKAFVYEKVGAKFEISAYKLYGGYENGVTSTTVWHSWDYPAFKLAKYNGAGLGEQQEEGRLGRVNIIPSIILYYHVETYRLNSHTYRIIQDNG